MPDVGEVKKGDWWRLSEEEFLGLLIAYHDRGEGMERLMDFHREALATVDRCRDALSRHMDREMDRRGA